MSDSARAGQKVVSTADVGKDVLTCFEKPVGTLEAVTEQREMDIAPCPGGRVYLRSIGRPCPADRTVRLQAEDVGMVTPAAVWLRL